MTWRAYYADGTRYSSAERSWSDLPADGMVGVVVFSEPPYRRIIDGADWIWMEGGEVRTSGTMWGGWVEPPALECRSCLKRCAALPDDEWKKVQREMTEDRRWP